MNSWQNKLAVVRRELAIWRKRPTYILGSLVVLVFCCIFFLTFFGQGLPSDLPIGVVDQDNSSLSRNFIRQLDATQLGKVVRYDNYSEARDEMQKGHLTAICVIPENFNDDVVAGRRPTFTYYYNALYFVGGSLSFKNIIQMINLTSGAVQRETLRAHGMSEEAISGRLRPVNVDVHQIGNTTTNYGIYLCNVLIPGMLELVVIMIMIYSLGTELKYGTSKHLIETAGGTFRDAIAGKILIYTVYFSALGVAIEFLLYHWMHFPMAGNMLWMILNVILLVMSSECVAIFILGLFPVCRFALSIGALYSVLGFSFSGFTLPVEAMLPWLQGLAAAFPLRHYFLFYVQEAIFGAGFSGWWMQICAYLIFFALPLLVARRLEGAYENLNYPKK